MKNARLPLLGAALVLLVSAILHPAAHADDDPVDDWPAEERFGGYVSSGTCRSCHPREYATWRASYHRTMTQIATPESVLGDFDNARMNLNGVQYRLFRKGDAFFAEWQRFRRGSQRTSRRVRRQLVLTTGSHHDQMYWYEAEGKGRALRQLPLDYSLRLDRWIPAQSTYLAPPGKGGSHPIGEWNRYCSKCHSVSPELRANDDGRLDTRVAEFGIACEACHGPAGEHVRLNRDPVHRYAQHLGEENDPSIVQPAHLDSKRSAEVCGQCHGVWMMGDELDGYRPGMKIHNRRVFVRPRYLDPDYQPTDDSDRMSLAATRAAVRDNPTFMASTYWSDGVLRVSGREYSGLRESPCFERGEITCNSCHTLHLPEDDPREIEQWRNDQLGRDMESNAACTSCHPQFAGDALASHTHHEAGSTGSLCYNCHMPFTVYGIQKAHRSHTVASPSADETLATGRPNACNQCHLDRTLAWTAQRLEQWYGLTPPAMAGDDVKVAAGALWALRGDAGQRALAAWSMGWDAARDASGAKTESDWMIPYLAQLLDDPYDSVRFVATLALRKRDAYATFDYDFKGSRSHRRNAADRARGTDRTFQVAEPGRRPAVLLDVSGKLATERFNRVLRQRDDRPVDIRE